MRTFLLGESSDVCGLSTRDEMHELINKAEELDTLNSVVLSLAAFIRSMWLLDNAEALELARKSNQLNPANALGIAYLGMVHTHLGDFETGYTLTRKANRLIVRGTTKSSIAYVAMRSAACAGHLSEALAIGEQLGRTAPEFIAPKHLIGLLYLKCDQAEKAEELLIELRRNDPDYSYDRMIDVYRASPLLKNSDIAINAPKHVFGPIG